MKRKIGEIYNKPIVEGDINLKGPNEIHKSELGGSNSEGGSSEVKEYYYLFDADKAIASIDMSEETFNSLYGQNQQIISLFSYGAMNVIYINKCGKELNAFLSPNHITQMYSFKNIKGFKVTDSIPFELVEGGEYEKDIKTYEFIGSIVDRYNKIINLFPTMTAMLPNPTLYTTQITKQEYEALIDIPNIIL